MPVPSRVLGSTLLGRARYTPFLGFGAFRERRALLPGADGLVTEFGRPDAVEDIMTEAKGPRTGLLKRYECTMPRAESTSKGAKSVFVDEELFTVLAALVYLHLV